MTSDTPDATASGPTPAARPASVIHEGLPTQLPDIDPDETKDWIDSFTALVEERGRERAICAASKTRQTPSRAPVKTRSSPSR